MHFNYMIVGQGLAGTLLGYELLKAGKSVIYIDYPDYPQASRVAAGLVNPVVFKRMAKSWKVDEFYPQMIQTYTELGNMLGETFFLPMRIRKVLAEGDECLWKRKFVENELEAYLSPQTDHREHPLLHSPYGCGWVEKAGRVDLKKMLSLFRKWLQNQHLLKEEAFQYDLLKIESDGIHYRDLHAGKLIFCEGYQGTLNPYFRQVYYKPVKGEILDLEIPDYREQDILNKSFFLMPAEDNKFRLGATYRWDQLDTVPTREGRDELIAKLSGILKTGFTITGHQAGIRPTAHDRRPVAGLHPEWKALGIFNGLGAKGCLTGPGIAAHFCSFLMRRRQLWPEVDVLRYYRAGRQDPG